jgi:hypothetical protein
LHVATREQQITVQEVGARRLSGERQSHRRFLDPPNVGHGFI